MTPGAIDCGDGIYANAELVDLDNPRPSVRVTYYGWDVDRPDRSMKFTVRPRPGTTYGPDDFETLARTGLQAVHDVATDPVVGDIIQGNAMTAAGRTRFRLFGRRLWWHKNVGPPLWRWPKALMEHTDSAWSVGIGWRFRAYSLSLRPDPVTAPVSAARPAESADTDEF